MGFDLAENTILLDFSATRYKGAEVRIRPDAVSLADYLDGWSATKTLKEEIAFIVDHGVIASWNLEKNGAPIPIEADAPVPSGMWREICRVFIESQIEVAAPLETTSPAGSS